MERNLYTQISTCILADNSHLHAHTSSPTQHFNLVLCKQAIWDIIPIIMQGNLQSLECYIKQLLVKVPVPPTDT